MHRLVSPFILEKFAAGQRAGDLSAASLFVDISGFSKLMYALMEHGQHGAEQMARLMRQIFDPLVAAVYGHDGFITLFAGDAFTALFPYQGNEGLALQRALATAWTIRQHLAGQDAYEIPYGRFQVGVKVGFGSGDCHWQIIDAKTGSRGAFYFRGTAVESASIAEKKAAKNEIVLTETVFQALTDRIVCEPIATHFRLLAVSEALPQPAPVNLHPPKLEHLRYFFPGEAVTMTHLGEFRHILNLFISLPSDLDDAQIIEFGQKVLALQEQYGGLLNSISFGDKGCTALLYWGAPVAYEHDIQRALNFILALQRQAAIPIRAGITYDIAHVGVIGSELQGEYTCNGIGVSLAARMMMYAAWGQLLVSRAVTAEPHFRFTPLGEIAYKGFGRPVATYELQGEEVKDHVFQQELVGREVELGQLLDFARPCLAGQRGGIALIHGEAGVGKSHLVYALRQTLGPPAKWLTGQSNAIRQQAFDPYVYSLKSYFNQDAVASERENKAQFEQQLANLLAALASIPGSQDRQRELQRTRSCLGALLGLRWPDTLYERLDAEGRFQNTLIAIQELFQAEAQLQPLVLVLEDGHWFDDASHTLLTRLSEQTTTSPLLILITSRYQDDGARFSFDVAPQTDLLQMDLKTLSPAALHLLAEAMLGMPIDDGLHRLLVMKSQANPFFAQQILHYLRQNNALSVTSVAGQQVASVAADHFNLPATLNTLLIARLDRLTPKLKEVVQTAAVLGREFEARLLAHMLKRDDLSIDLARGEQEQIWALPQALNYIFQHILLRDAAYDMQLRARLRQLHYLAAQAYEALYGDDLRPYYSDLAYHYGQAQIADMEFHYALEAGRQIAGQFISQDAIKYFSRALTLAPQLSLSTDTWRTIYLQRGRVWELLMEHDKAYENYREMAALAEQKEDESLAMAAMVAKIILFTTVNPYFDPEQGQALADEGLALAQALSDKAAEAKILWGLMLAHGLGRLDWPTSIAYGQQSVALARELDLPEQLAVSLNDLSRALGLGGHLSEGRTLALEARERLQQVGNHPLLLDNYHGYALLSDYAGDFAAAYQSAQQAIQLGKELNNFFAWVNGTCFMAVCLLEQGHWGEALALYETLLVPGRGPVQFVIGISSYLCHAHMAIGLVDEETTAPYVALTEKALQSGPFFKNWFVGQLVRLYVVRGDLAAAAAALARCEFDLDSTPFSSIASILFLADVQLAFALGDMARAEQKVDRAIELFTAAGQRLWLLDLLLIKAKIQHAVGQTPAGEATLLHALSLADPSERRVRWQLLAMLAQLAQAEGRVAEAEQRRAQAQTVIDYILASMAKAEWREAFLQRVDSWL